MTRIRPNYGEILRLGAMGLTQQDIAVSVGVSKNGLVVSATISNRESHLIVSA